MRLMHAADVSACYYSYHQLSITVTSSICNFVYNIIIYLYSL